MRTSPERATLTIMKHQNGWAVELAGEVFGASPEKEVAKANAHKRARELAQSGQPVQIRVQGELGL